MPVSWIKLGKERWRPALRRLSLKYAFQAECIQSVEGACPNASAAQKERSVHLQSGILLEAAHRQRGEALEPWYSVWRKPERMTQDLPATYEEYQRQLSQSTNRDVFDPEQSSQEIQNLRLTYLDLQHRATALETDDDLVSLIDTCTQLYQRVKKPSEAFLDSSLFLQSADAGLRRCAALAERSNLYSLEQLLASLSAAAPSDLESFGRTLNVFSRRVPPIECLLGPIKRIPTASSGDRQPGEATKKRKEPLPDAPADRPVVGDQPEHEPAPEGTSDLVIRVFQALRKAAPVSFLRFFINPSSFGQSVENLFYCSFLVKEDRARLWVDRDTGELMIDTVGDEGESSMDAIKNQLVTKFDHDTWQRAIKRYSIITASIPDRPLANSLK